MKFDCVDYLCILGMIDNVNNNSKEDRIGEATVSVKIKQFYELLYNSIMRLSVLI